MKRISGLGVFFLFLASFLAPMPLAGQQGCQPPPPATGSGEANIFNAQQEMDLGEAVAEHVQRSFRVIADDDVISYLQRLGERMVKHVPATNLHYQFFLFDLPVSNAFGLPGGRIYVSRKLIAAARSEDELAGVLGHELGHLVARQAAIDMTRVFREVIGVTSVGDRRDIFAKYNQLVESVARRPGAFQHGRKSEQQEQIIADRIAVFASATAGYSPQSYAEFWDRRAETKGKTGGWLSDLFGATRPESRRLREILKEVAALPAACVEKRAGASADEFQKWQAAVINYTGLGHKEALHAVLAKKALEPPLRDDINHLRFSTDGKYVLAQDDSSIYILSREPFAPLFRIDAPEAHAAQFTPDMQSVVFYTANLRVETWNIADEQRTAAQEVVLNRSCLQTELSPDGKTLSCLGRELELLLYDVATGAQICEKKSFYEPRSFAEAFNFFLAQLLGLENFRYVNMAFSPDAKYFAAGRSDSALAVDLTTRAQVSMPGGLKKLLSTSFAFLGPDRLIGVDPFKRENSAIARFPSGEVLDHVTLGQQSLAAAGHGDFVLLRPIEKFPVGVMDLKTKKINLANKTPALDVYDDLFVSERRNGELGLYRQSKPEPVTVVTLPRAPLGYLRGATLSSDLRWLAISERHRGAVWDLNKGERVFYVRGFQGAYFGEDGTFYGDFPEFEGKKRTIARLNLTNREVSDGVMLEGVRASQYGAYIVITKPAKERGSLGQNIIVELQDTRTGRSLWTRSFPKEAPTIWVEPREGTLVLSWGVEAGAAKDEIKADAATAHRLESLKEKKGAHLLEVLEASSGKVLGKLLVETGKGSFRISRAFAAGNSVIVSDNENRVLVYALATGEAKGKTFGRYPVVAREAGLLAVENERGQVVIYDLNSLEKRDEFVFSSPISLMQFGSEGKRLFVLTSSQNAYWLDLSAARAAASATAKH